MNIQNTKIKVALLYHSDKIPAWAAYMVEQINKSNVAKISVFIKSIKKAESLNILWQAYKCLDAKIFDDGLNSVALKPLPAKGYATYITIPDEPFNTININLLKQLELDVIIAINNCAIPQQLYSFTKNGIWKIESNYSNNNYFSTVGVHDFFLKNPVSISKLVAYKNSNEPGSVLYESASCTHNFSLTKNMNQVLWKSALFPVRVFKQITDTTSLQYFLQQKQTQHKIIASNEQLFSFAKKTISKMVHKIFYTDQWSLQIDTKYSPDKAFKPSVFLQPSLKKFWADPFIVHENNKLYIFFEEMDCTTNKAHLSVLVTDEKGLIEDNRVILNMPYHLSYPFIFKHENKWFMIPETSAAKNIQLYECINFPFEWKHKMNLMENIHAADVTLHYYNNCWQLFANVKEHEGICDYDELFIFSSKELFSTNWKPHQQNPVISDCRLARPAGSLFQQNGQLIRPSQNSNGSYGYATNFNVIEMLTEEIYVEKKITDLLPDSTKKMLCTHTFNYDGKFAITDAIIAKKKWKR